MIKTKHLKLEVTENNEIKVIQSSISEYKNEYVSCELKKMLIIYSRMKQIELETEFENKKTAEEYYQDIFDKLMDDKESLEILSK